MRRVLFSLVLTFGLGVVGSAAAQDDVGRAEAAICCGAACCAIASGDGCQDNGDVNPADSCEVCDVSQSQTSFTRLTTPECSGASDAGPTSGGGGGCSATGASSSTAGLVFGLVSLGLFFRRRR